MTPKPAASDEVNNMSDLDEDQREDLEAMCDDGLMPAQIARRMGIPTRVAADARRSWKRRKDLEEAKVAPAIAAVPVVGGSDPLASMMMITQQQLQQTLIQEQINAMVENNRHRKEANKLEERERRLEIAEREAQFRDDFAHEESKDTTLDSYNFEADPLGAVVRLGKDLKEMNNSSDAIRSPQSNDVPNQAQELTDDQIAAYMAKQSAKLQGQALAAVDNPPYHDELVGVLAKQKITGKNLEKVLAWLRAEKKRRTGIKK